MKYIVTSELFLGEISFTYNSDHYLCEMEVRADMQPKQWTHLLANLPVTEDMIIMYRTEYTRYRQVPVDLSFENFWRVYNYKEGYKMRCEKIWNALSLADQVAAMDYIRIYDGKLAQTRQNKKNPETYLNQKPWLNNK